MAYLLDTNVFIKAKNEYYGLDFCPGFWDWLLDANHTSKVFSVEKVLEELSAGKDQLSKWANREGRGIFLEPDSLTMSSLTYVSQWANSQQFEPRAIAEFLEVADYYLVAHAHAHSQILVSHELPSGGQTKKRIKIPDVCRELGVGCTTVWEMLRQEGIQLVLEK